MKREPYTLCRGDAIYDADGTKTGSIYYAGPEAMIGAGCPLQYRSDGVATDAHPPIVWRRRKCRRSGHAYPLERAGLGTKFPNLWRAYAGRLCKRGKGGWICPHRQFPLGSIAPDAGGVIVCPLHGLRIDAATGVVVGEAKA